MLGRFFGLFGGRSPGRAQGKRLGPYAPVKKVRNPVLTDLRLRLGLTQRELAERAGVTTSTYCNLEAAQMLPLGSRGWGVAARRLSEFHQLPEAYLFPEEVLEASPGWSGRTLLRDVQHLVDPPESVLRLALPPSVQRESGVLQDSVRRMLSSLTPREEAIILRRFYAGETYAEIGRDFDLSFERIRQIEGRALRKLKHPSQATFFRPFCEGQSEEDAAYALHTAVCRYNPVLDPEVVEEERVREFYAPDYDDGGEGEGEGEGE